MYQIFSSTYGSMTRKEDLKSAQTTARHYKNCTPDATITIWYGGEKIETF